VKGMGVGEVLRTPQSPWQNPCAERLIGSIRRECVITYLSLANGTCAGPWLATSRTTTGRALTSLDKDAPHGRPIERPELGKVIPIREVGGLHPRYIRRAA
jgi:putative transposase